MTVSRQRLFRAAAATLLAVAAFGVQAGPEARRFAAELAVLSGDARALLEDELAAHHRRGLHARLRGGLAGLRWRARLYLAERGGDGDALLREIDRLRQLYAAEDLVQFTRRARELVRRYPLPMTGIDPQGATDRQREAGRGMYRRLCRGCHEHPDPAREAPARNLFQQARRLPRKEFMARLLLGIRGTPEVGLLNPFTDAELAGLAAYLIRGEAVPPAH